MTEQHRYHENRSLSKAKEMVKTIPPSPAPSNSELSTNGMSRPIDESFSSGSYYPHDQQQHISMQSIHPGSQPQSRFGTPGPPPQQQQMYYNRSHLMPHQQPYGASQYPPPQQYPNYSPLTSYDEYSSQPYSTPATSPPTPNRGIVTRSVRATTTQPAAKTTPTPKRKKAERTKAVKKSPMLDGPMSIITKNSSIEVVDIEAYVNRSAEERRKEVATGKIPGKIKRPMNAFMLYRKAYQNRAKEWCSQHNHQVVSQVCGDSWPLEPDAVRAQFNEWAKLERDNHQKAHPGYKFTPSKPQKLRVATPSSSKRGRYDDDESVLSDPDDPEWMGGRGGKRVKRDHTRYDPSEMYRPQGMYDNYAPHGMPDQNRSAFHATNPGKPLPQPYEPVAAMGGHYYQTMQSSRDPYRQVEDVVYRKTLSPGNPLQQYPHQYSQYESPTGYLSQSQQYAETHHGQGAGQSTYAARPSSFSRSLDPNLMGTGGDDGLLGLGQYPHQVDPAHGQWQDAHHPSYPPQQTQYYQGNSPLPFESYGNVVGDEVSPLTSLFNREQEKLFKSDATGWQIIESGAAADESWQDAETIEPSALGQSGVQGHAEAGSSS